MSTTTLALPQRMQRELRFLRTGFRFLGTVAPKLTGRIALNMFLTPNKRPVSANARTLMAQANRHHLAHGSRKLAVYEWEGAGPTVLLVHGWESNAGDMRCFLRPLLIQGFRVIAFDGPAHGHSTGKQTNLIDYGGAIQTVIHHFGPVYGIVAHSFGAAATLFTLVREPSLPVQRVVSLGAPSRLKEMVDIWTGFVGMSPASAEQMRQRLVDRVGLPLDSMIVANAAAALTIPGLIIHDRDDKVVNYTNAEAIHRNWSTSALYTTTGLDHRGPLQDRSVLRRVVTFLSDGARQS